MSMRNTMKHSFASGFGAGLGWAAASATVRAIGQGISEIGQPSRYQCAECSYVVPTNTTVNCTLCHAINSVSHTHCSQCQTELCIPCPTCHQPCQFRLSTGAKISQGFSSMGQSVKQTANAAATSAVDLTKKPRTLDCDACHQPIAVPPRPSYTCQYCTTVHANPESDNPTCGNCHGKQSLPQQQVTCQRCTHVQVVPSIKITHEISQGWNKMKTGIKKAAWAVSNTPHVACPRCNKPVKLQPQQQQQQPQNNENAAVVAADGEWSMVQAVRAPAPSAVPAAQAAPMLTCQECQLRFTPAPASAPPAAHPKSN